MLTSAFCRTIRDQRGRVTYLQIAPTSRSEVPEYAALSRTVNEFWSNQRLTRGAGLGTDPLRDECLSQVGFGRAIPAGIRWTGDTHA